MSATHPVVDDAEWLRLRTELLEKEKEFQKLKVWVVAAAVPVQGVEAISGCRTSARAGVKPSRGAPSRTTC